jgi:two-component system cell cycle response regulator
MVRHVTDGERAIRDALDEPPDLIILDIMLPGIDGFEVCRQVKNDARLKHTQILVQTSLRELDYRIQGTELGADDYLVKPVDSRELKVRIDALLKKKRYIDKLNHRYESALNRAIRDGLTGLYNHEYFKRFFKFEIKRSLRQRHSISLLLIDLDNFKQVNDRLGHQAGDRILIQVGKTIRGSVRDVDFVARYGGEEFVVILPYVDAEKAREVAERVRLEIKTAVDTEIKDLANLSVTASIGGAFCPDDGMEAESVIRKADEMMYLAKQLGKDQICLTSEY